jgi:hypothetical protein
VGYGGNVDPHLEHSQDRWTSADLFGDERRTGIRDEKQPISDTTEDFANRIWCIFECLRCGNQSGQGRRACDKIGASRVAAEHFKSKRSLSYICGWGKFKIVARARGRNGTFGRDLQATGLAILCASVDILE